MDKLGEAINSTAALYAPPKQKSIRELYLSQSGRIFLMLEIPNLPTLDEMIKENIKIVRNNTNKPS